jgi:hypothetical protein
LSDIILNKEGVSDLTKKREFLFLGPDENTAGINKYSYILNI